MDRPHLRAAFLAIASLLVAAAASAPAQTNFFWTGTAGFWADGANWTNLPSGSSAPLAGGSNDYALTFARLGTFTTTNNAGSPSFLLNQLVFAGSAATLRGSNLTFISNSSGGLPQIQVVSNVSLNVYNPVALSNDVTVAAATGTLTFNTAISGSGGFIKDGAGTLRFITSNSFSGGVTLNSGTINILLANGLGVFGTGTLTLNGGTLAHNGSLKEILNPVVIGGNWTLGGSSGTPAPFVFSSNVNLGGATRTITVTGFASNSVFKGAIANGGLAKSGIGTLLFSNASSTYADGTFVNQGTLALGWGADLASGVLVSNGATLLVTGGVSSVGGAVTNLGAVQVINARATWGGPVLVSGSYVSDPSTNVFSGNLAVAGTGFVSAAAGDLYVFNRDFLLQSSNGAAFNMSQARLMFTNDGSGADSHVLNLTGGLALDLGKDFTNFLDQALVTNFSLGEFAVAPGNNVQLAGARGAGFSNALYVGWLDLGGSTNNLASALTLDVNMYYDRYDARNAYLGGLTYDLWGAGGGLLIPIPEPATSALVLLGLGFLLRRRVA
jgi:autotransporter-associated beta strand protein